MIAALIKKPDSKSTPAIHSKIFTRIIRYFVAIKPVMMVIISGLGGGAGINFIKSILKQFYEKKRLLKEP